MRGLVNAILIEVFLFTPVLCALAGAVWPALLICGAEIACWAGWLGRTTDAGGRRDV